MGWVIAALLALIVGVALWPFAAEWRRKPLGEAERRGASGEFVRLKRGVTHFTWSGPKDGPVVVCVHGLTTASFVWDGLVPGLVEMGYRVLTYDHYGRGLSDRPGGAQDRRFYLDHLSELLDSQAVTGPVTLIGYSMGGTISTAWTAENPGRLRRLVIVASAGLNVNAGLAAAIMRKVPGLGDWMMFQYFPKSHMQGTNADRGVSPQIDRVVDLQQRELQYRGFLGAVLSSMRGVLSFSTEADHKALAQAGVPVLALWGQDDPLIPISSMDRLAGWNPDAGQVVIPGANHSVTFTHPGAILEGIEGPLRGDLA